jgi:hypothetical protein
MGRLKLVWEGTLKASTSVQVAADDCETRCGESLCRVSFREDESTAISILCPGLIRIVQFHEPAQSRTLAPASLCHRLLRLKLGKRKNIINNTALQNYKSDTHQKRQDGTLLHEIIAEITL